MIRAVTLLALGTLVSVSAGAAELEWVPMLQSGDLEGARQACSSALSSDSVPVRTEAHKCMANLILVGGDRVALQSGDKAAAQLRAGFEPEATKKALQHLGSALELSPQDLSVHQARIHLLMMAGRYDETSKALADSLGRLEGDVAADTWLAYSAVFHQARQHRSAIDFLHVLAQHYPDDHRVVANLGGFHILLKEDDKALPYTQRAVELSPEDPINNWNLARLYDYRGDIKQADHYYQTALRLDPKGQAVVNPCVYAEFLETKLEDPERACGVKKAHCEAEWEKSCPLR